MCMRSEISTAVKLGCSLFMMPFSLILSITIYSMLSLFLVWVKNSFFSVMEESRLIVFRHRNLWVGYLDLCDVK